MTLIWNDHIWLSLLYICNDKTLGVSINNTVHWHCRVHNLYFLCASRWAWASEQNWPAHLMLHMEPRGIQESYPPTLLWSSMWSCWRLNEHVAGQADKRSPNPSSSSFQLTLPSLLQKSVWLRRTASAVGLPVFSLTLQHCQRRLQWLKTQSSLTTKGTS